MWDERKGNKSRMLSVCWPELWGKWWTITVIGTIVWGKQNQVLHNGYNQFEMPTRYSSGDIKKQVGYRNLALGGTVYVEGRLWRLELYIQKSSPYRGYLMPWDTEYHQQESTHSHREKKAFRKGRRSQPRLLRWCGQ